MERVECLLGLWGAWEMEMLVKEYKDLVIQGKCCVAYSIVSLHNATVMHTKIH